MIKYKDDIFNNISNAQIDLNMLIKLIRQGDSITPIDVLKRLDNIKIYIDKIEERVEQN